jgi:hypothetical protein
MANGFGTIIVLAGLLTGTAGAHAQCACDNSSLQGQYAFKVVGTLVGVLDSSGTLHPLTSPLPINAVGQATFDGEGGYT